MVGSRQAKYELQGELMEEDDIVKSRYGNTVTDTILAVVRLLERDINRLVVEARESLKPVKP